MTGALAAGGSRFAASRPAADRRLAAALALVWAAGVAATVAVSSGMSEAGEIPMPGGWSMSAMWTDGCGGSALASAGGFLAMWIAMTAAMMTPALAPALTRYRRSLAKGPRGALTALAAAGYFAAWAALGLAVWIAGREIASALIEAPGLARVAPIAFGVVVAAAGALQFTRWKSERLARCRAAPFSPPRKGEGAEASRAFLDGLRLGRDCCLSCAGPTAALLAWGVMDLRAMAVASAAVISERLSPAGDRIARLAGAAAIAAGLAASARAIGVP